MIDFYKTADMTSNFQCFFSALAFLLPICMRSLPAQHALVGWLLMGFFVSLAIVFRGLAILHGFYYSVRALFLLHTKRLDLRFAVAESMGVGFTVPPFPVVRQNAGRL
jgi:hypothetical protein